MPEQQERRQHLRYFGQDLVVTVGDQRFPVADISAGGLCFEGTPLAQGAVRLMTLSSAATPEDGIATHCRVVAIRPPFTHVAFAAVNMTLLTYVMAHISDVLGVSPYYFNEDFVPARVERPPRQSDED